MSNFDIPEPVAGLFEVSDGGVFVNCYGDKLVEPAIETRHNTVPELILVRRADGSTATLRGEWETGFEA